MATATNTTEGQILLSGDLTGTGENPELRASGVVPRAYNTVIGAPNSTGASVGTVPKMVIDSKGRVVYASTVSGNLQFQVANSTTNGLVKVDGTTVTASGGVLSSIVSNPPIATSSVNGAVKGGSGISTGITFDDPGGPNYPMFAMASMRTDRRGRWVPDRTTISIDNSGIASAIRAKATSSTIGVVKPDNSTILVDSNGTITAVAAPIATSSTTGIVKVGNGLSVDGAGTISVTTPWTYQIASASILGGIKQGTGFGLTGASTTNATISVSTASSSFLGVSRPDNTSVTVSNGVLTSVSRLPASSSSLGVARPDGSISINSGVLSMARASSSSLGIARPDGSININSGVLSIDTSLTSIPATSATVLGKTRIGANMNVSGGMIYQLTANAGQRGVMRGDGTTISSVGGVISLMGEKVFNNQANTFNAAQFIGNGNGGLNTSSNVSLSIGQAVGGVSWSNNLRASMTSNVTITYNGINLTKFPSGSKISCVVSKGNSGSNIVFSGDIYNKLRIQNQGTGGQLASHGTFSAGAFLRFEMLILNLGSVNIGLIYNETYN